MNQRVIKFRAWSRKGNTFLRSDVFDKLLEGKKLTVAFAPRFFLQIQGNPFTDRNLIVEQFTGLKDKNGKEIYEGDIVRSRFIETSDSCDIKQPFCDHTIHLQLEPGVHDFIGRIVFANGAFRWLDFRYESWEECVAEMENEPGVIDPETDEVIGNIHENPELLK